MFETDQIIQLLQNEELSLKEKRKLLVEDTKNYYQQNPLKRRAKTSGSCCYRSVKNQACAIGRLFDNETITMLREKDLLFSSITETLSRLSSDESKLIPEFLLDLKVDFLNQLQYFHDHNGCWNSQGLSLHGEHIYSFLLSRYC